MQGRPDGRRMKFTKNELIMVGRHASGGREETIEKLDRERAVSEDALDRAFMYNAAEKLKRLAEPECSRFIAGVLSAMAELDGSIHRKLALAKAEKNVVLGHDMSGRERFQEDTGHMILFDVLKDSSPAGSRGDHYRAFLSDERYRNAKQSEERGEIKIRSHAAVRDGCIIPDRKQREHAR